MTSYRISDNADTITVEAASITDALSGMIWQDVTAIMVSADENEHYVLWHPGTPDTEEEIGDDSRHEIISGRGPIETDWMPIWQTQ